MVTANGEPSGTQTVVDWRIVVAVGGGILGVIVVRNVFVEAHRVIGWAVAAIVVAVLLAPVIERIDRVLPRALAVASTFVVVIAIGAGVAALYTTSLRSEADRLVEGAPNIAADLESRGDRLGDLTQKFHLTDRVDELAARLDEAVGTGSDTIRSAALSAPAYFVSMILTIFFLVFGPRIVTGGLDQLSPERRARLAPALQRGVRRSQRYVWATLAQSAAVGGAITVLAFWLDVPAPALLGLVAALAGLIPYLGVLIGSLPLLLLGLGVSPAWQVGVAALIMVGVLGIEAAWWRPLVHRTSLYVGPAIPLIVAVLGYAVYGIGGALYSMALGVFALALVDELDISTDDLPTPTDDYDGDAPTRTIHG
jgi:predicted PurR-regulated permease PerM